MRLSQGALKRPLTQSNFPCTVDVNTKLKGGSANITQPQDPIFYTITPYVLDRHVKTRVLSQVYLSNQSHQFLLMYSCLLRL
jgi:hypothetical protein